MKSPPHNKMLSNPNWEFMSKFTDSFLRSLLRINKNPPNCDENQMIERCERVKIAADKSLASAAGQRRAWSRALLFKIRHRARRHKWRRRRPKRISLRRVGVKRAEYKVDEAKKLRRLVPGGEAMELCNLLEEASHYVMCLNSQVQVMRCIADFCSTT